MLCVYAAPRETLSKAALSLANREREGKTFDNGELKKPAKMFPSKLNEGKSRGRQEGAESLVYQFFPDAKFREEETFYRSRELPR